MNLRERDDWRDEVLREILAAIAADADLVTTLVFKGARVLQMHLPGATRRSLDLDANLSREFIERYPGRQRQADVLRAGLERALQRHFDAQSPSHYRVASAALSPRHPGRTLSAGTGSARRCASTTQHDHESRTSLR